MLERSSIVKYVVMMRVINRLHNYQQPVDKAARLRYLMDMHANKNTKKVMSDSEMLDKLAWALAEEVATETGRSKLDVLEEIIELGESPQLNNSNTFPPVQRNALA